MLKFLLTLLAKSWAFSGLVLAVLLPNLSVGQLRGPFGSRKFVILRHDFFGSDPKLMELQNFSELIVDSWFIFNFFLQLVDGGFGVRILCVIVQPPKPTFLLDEV